METIRYIILSLVCVFSFLGTYADDKKSELFNENWRWDYRVIVTGSYIPPINSILKFEGTQEYAGKLYQKLVCDYQSYTNSPEEEFCRLTLPGDGKPVLVREENGKVFARFPNDWRFTHDLADYEEEIPLYDFDCEVGDVFKGLTDEGIMDMTVTKIGHVNIQGRDLRLLHVWPNHWMERMDLTEDSYYQVLEDVGIVSGGFLCYFQLSLPTGAPPVTRSITPSLPGTMYFCGLFEPDGTSLYGSLDEAVLGKQADKVWEYATVQELRSQNDEEVIKHYTLSSYWFDGLEKRGDFIYNKLYLKKEKNWTTTFRADGSYECSPVEETEKDECVGKFRPSGQSLYMLLPDGEDVSYTVPPYTNFFIRPAEENEEVLLYPMDTGVGETEKLWFDGYIAPVKIAKKLVDEDANYLYSIIIANFGQSDSPNNNPEHGILIDKSYRVAVGNVGLGTFQKPQPNDDDSRYDRYGSRTFFNNIYVNGYDNRTGKTGWYVLYKGADISPTNPGAVGDIAADNVSDNAPAAVYDLCGRKVLTGAAESDLRDLPKGIYIYKGRKIII